MPTTTIYEDKVGKSLTILLKGLRRRIFVERTISGGEVREGKQPLNFNVYRFLAKSI